MLSGRLLKLLNRGAKGRHKPKGYVGEGQDTGDVGH